MALKEKDPEIILFNDLTEENKNVILSYRAQPLLTNGNSSNINRIYYSN